ncbi:MAG: YbbR-like domain-containing protein [Tannerella sp.]|jgi:hypothetical protein|nr:YbbR-like domain-containing protein [Tannerella sp.]
MTTWLDKYNPFKSKAKIKAFLFQPYWKETLLFLFFLALALGFWLLQNLRQEYEMEISIPVKYKNIPEEMGSMDEYPQEIKAKVRDRGNVLMNYSWLHFFSPVEINLSDIRKANIIQVPGKTIEASILKQIVSTTTLIEFEPQTMTLEYKALQSKEVDVEADISVLLEPGFRISGSISVIPEKVRLYANGNILDSISIVKTVFSEVKKANQTKQIKLRLQKINGAKMEPDEVTVNVPIEEFTEKRISIAIKCNGIPEPYNLRTFPSSVEIVCNIPLSRFKELVETDFEILIPFQEFEAVQSQGKISLYLTKKPLWVVNPVMIPDMIEFIIEKNNP